MKGLSPAAVEGFVSGMDTRDDAGYIPFGGGLLLQSVDFFTPVVDDPYRFGQISAANALSDIYAMAGTPLTAMNLAAFPCSLDLGILREILAGGQSKIEESEAALCGGHTIQDDEPKYGLSVTGFVENDKVVRNVGARPGDALMLTKPLGVGILTTALKKDLVSENEIQDAIESAARLNKGAGAAIREIPVSAATDVTGFGLLGHLHEMVEGSGVGAVVRRRDVPVFEKAAPLAAQGHYPGGLASNLEYLDPRVVADGIAPEDLLPLFDPQTSGGLLISVAPDHTTDLVAALETRGTPATVIGEVVEGTGIRVVI